MFYFLKEKIKLLQAQKGQFPYFPLPKALREQKSKTKCIALLQTYNKAMAKIQLQKHYYENQMQMPE